MKRALARLVRALKPCAKAVVAGAAGAIASYVTAGTAQGFNLKALGAAAAGGALTALVTFLTPNRKVAKR